jgi:type IX secretion system PorP/SprF family membrane protein
MKRLSLILFGAFAAFTGMSQDMHFSQFNEHHQLLNPALTGASENLRITGGYRNQWLALGSSFNSFGASLEMRGFGRKKRVGRFGFSRTRRESRFAAGISAYRDKSGDGSFINTQGALTLATFVPLGNKSFVSLGFQGAYVQSQLDGSNFLYPDQYGTDGYDPGLPSFDKAASASFGNFDLAGGILWSYGHNVKGFTDDKEIKVKAGVSAFHINEPALPYMKNSKDVVHTRLVGHMEMIISLGGPRTSIAPVVLYEIQGSYAELVAGAMYRFYNTSTDSRYTGYFNRTTMAFGLYYRHNDAIIPNLLLEMQEQYAIGISYDISISKVTNATYRGGLEVSLRFTPPSAFLYQKR